MGKTAFLSPVPVKVCDRVRLTLITGGLSVPYCPFCKRPAWSCESRTASSLKLAVFIVSRPEAVRISSDNHSSLPVGTGLEVSAGGLQKQTPIQMRRIMVTFLGRVPSLFQASAFPVSESASTIGLLWSLQWSHPQTQIQTRKQLRKGETDTANKQDGGWMPLELFSTNMERWPSKHDGHFSSSPV